MQAHKGDHTGVAEKISEVDRLEGAVGAGVDASRYRLHVTSVCPSPPVRSSKVEGKQSKCPPQRSDARKAPQGPTAAKGRGRSRRPSDVVDPKANASQALVHHPWKARLDLLFRFAPVAAVPEQKGKDPVEIGDDAVGEPSSSRKPAGQRPAPKPRSDGKPGAHQLHLQEGLP